MTLICDEAIKILLDSVNMKEEDKEYFIDSLPDLDEAGRESLYDMLKRIYAREVMEQKATADISKYWDK